MDQPPPTSTLPQPPAREPTRELTKAAMPPWEDPELRRDVLEALRRGDPVHLAALFHRGVPHVTAGSVDLARFVIEVRRREVALLGDAEVFVRRGPSGDLQQVVAPVTLSLDDGTLYQIPDRREKQVRGKPGVRWDYHQHRGQPYDWVAIYDRPDRADVSAEGYLRMNRVAGCSQQLPPTVRVDGADRENPCVVRDANGDTTRIVIRTRVVGPAPATGNIIVVDYLLDLDPRTDLLHMIGATMKKWKSSKKQEAPPEYSEYEQDVAQDAEEQRGPAEAAFLCTRSAFDEFAAAQPAPTANRARRWHWMPIAHGMGLAHDTGHADVIAAYSKYIEIMANALKKATTVARRNAMKAHPALAMQHVHLRNGARETRVAVVGWTVSGPDVGRYAAALDAVARGETHPGIELIVASETYTPTEHATGDPELDPVVPEPTDEQPAPRRAVIDEDTLRRNEILAEIDAIVASDGFPDRAIASIGYTPTIGQTASIADLEAMLDNARAAVGRGGGK